MDNFNLIRSSVETIVEIESTFDVNSVKCNDLMIWPLVRSAIWSQLLSPELNLTRGTTQCHKKIPTLDITKEQLNLLKSKSGIDFLFFSSIDPPAEYVEKLDEKIYSPFIDSMINFVKKRYSALKIEIVPPDMIKNQAQRYEQSFFINPVTNGFNAYNNEHIAGFKSLKKVVGNIAGIQIDSVVFLNQIKTLCSWHDFFIKILSVIKPAAVFLVCYYHLIAYSLIWVCKKLKISTVDIQHGARGRYQANYTHWTKIPHTGYEFLPDYFWCWGDISKNDIKNTRPLDCVKHKPIVGGNLRISDWITNGRTFVSEDQKEFFEYLKTRKKVILIALSNPSMTLPEFVLRAIKNISSSWFWLIRLHPYHSGESERKRIVSIFKQNAIENFDIDFSTDCHLYDVLKNSDHHITFLSSTCYEALIYDVPTTFIHSVSLQAYGDDIKKGVFSYAETSGQLIESIRQGLPGKEILDKSKYIETNRKAAERALKIVNNMSPSYISKKVKIDEFENKKTTEASLNEPIQCYSKNLYTESDLDLLPSTFTLETILGCDLKCPECAVGGGFVKRKKGRMTFEKFEIIAKKIKPYCKYLYLHIWGEPLLNKDIFKILNYASGFTKTHISTNGNLMTEETAEKLIKSGVSDIIVSIDGISQEVYEQYRVSGQVEKAVNALENLAKFKAQFGSAVNISPQFIVFKHNQHEMEQFNEISRAIGLKPIFKAPYIRRRNSRFKLSDYSKFKRPVYKNLHDLKAAMKECPNVKNVFTILLDGSVVLCCHDYGKATFYGNIFEQSVEDIWNSGIFRKERYNILSGDAPKFCTDNCMTWCLDKNVTNVSVEMKNSKSKNHAIKFNNEPFTSKNVPLETGNFKKKEKIPNGNKINLCSGSNKIGGFVNIDFLPGADIVLDLEKDLIPFSDNSVSVAVCNSAINYFTRNRAQEIINDVYRVLMPGGIVRFGTQDLRVLVEKYVNNDIEFYFQKLPGGRERFPGDTIGDKLNEFFYGFGVRDKHCKYLYDYESLKTLFQNAGFHSIKQKRFQESLIPEIDMIDNRPNQMFFLEAVKIAVKKHTGDCEDISRTKLIESIIPEQTYPSAENTFESIREIAFKKWENDEFDKAWQYFLKVLDLKPDDTQTVMKCIEILETQGRFNDILKVCNKYLMAKPGDYHIRKVIHNVQDRIKMDIPDPKIVAQGRADITKLNSHNNAIHSDEKHLEACLQWLIRAQNAHRGGGVSSIYHLETKRWDVDYPETTGYIIPTFLSYHKYSGADKYLRSAIEMGDWEVDIQAPDGGAGEPLGVYGLQPRVFNTGQIIFGWMALYKETGDSKYIEAAQKAANWIVESQDSEGKWSRNTFMGPKAYHSRVAWSLLELYHISKEQRWKTAANNAINWILSLGHQNGWFEKNSLTARDKPWTHLVGYVLVGLLESCMLDSHNCNITKLLSLLSNAAKNLANYCIKTVEISGNGQLKTLPGTFDQNWMSNDNWTCVTGNAQIAFFLRKMFSLFNDDSLITASNLLIKQLKSYQFIDGVSDANLYGGLPGSYPIGGGYASYTIPNWGVKFFADALLLRTASFSDQRYLG